MINNQCLLPLFESNYIICINKTLTKHTHSKMSYLQCARDMAMGCARLAAWHVNPDLYHRVPGYWFDWKSPFLDVIWFCHPSARQSSCDAFSGWGSLWNCVFKLTKVRAARWSWHIIIDEIYRKKKTSAWLNLIDAKMRDVIGKYKMYAKWLICFWNW